ncbi:DUF4136 domain-containing protein [Maribacter halichondriae]|uniref:DUF4136 domain-containing protein n=1 Tax=Maribacter halichondriae TaxID=2980554 RepID=UPI00235A3B50|nr:DUF4136 domain-containing protein [Maribacter sp. Hal144]
MRCLPIIFFVSLFISCSAVRVNYDYDKETDFSNYNTYNFYPDMQTGLTELDNKRLFKALDIALQSKGLVFSEEPDFLIDIEGRSYQAPQNTSVGVGVGGTGRNVGGGVSVGIPVGRPNLERILQFDFVDAKKDMLFWQAISTSSLKEDLPPVVREQKFQELVVKVLKKYPPKSKK